MSPEKKTNEDILATIVLYNTSLEQSSSFQSLSDSLSCASDQLDVLVYDNSPSKMYTGKKYDFWNIYYYHDIANSGVSKAYNHAGMLAKSLGKKWILLLDQDTYFPKKTISTYLHLAQKHNSGLFAPRLFSMQKLISPFKIVAGEGKVVAQLHSGKHSLNHFMPVNSGMLVSVKDFWSSGGYNEDFPLDYSDFAFIERFKKIRPEFEVIDLICKHQFSGLENSDSKNSALKRFRLFCISTSKYKETICPNLNVHKLIIKRALKLALIFRSIEFLKMAVQTLNKNK